MGKRGLATVLSMAGLEAYMENMPPDNLAQQFDFAYLAAISQALEDMYGARGGRGIALRVGRATFSKGLKDFGAFAGMATPTFQALPLEKRAQIGVNALAAVFTNFSDQTTILQEEETVYTLLAESSPMAWGRTADRPVCHAITGIIQEGLRWASRGYEFNVQEIACRAASNPNCIFRINKNPIGGAILG